MRIDTLHLLAFGPFTDVELQFDKPGLQIVFGRNGAGKSTSLRALNGLLFGIPVRTRDAWLHGMPDLRVGGRLGDGVGTPIDVVRRKGNKATLRDLSENPVDDAELTQLLGGITEGLYGSMFGLNQRGLRAGGEDLLRGRGDLGAALFGAGMGSSAVHALLTSLDADAEELFTPRGRNQRVNAAVREYTEQSAEARALSVSTREWAAHREALAHAMGKREELDADIQDLEVRRSRAMRVLSVLGPLAERTERRTELEALTGVPELAEDAPERRRTALADLERAAAEQEKAQEAIARHRTEIDGIEAPAALVGRQDEIADLSQRIGEIRKGERDLPKLRGQLEAEEREALTALGEVDPLLTLDGAEARRVTAALRATVLDLARQRPDLVKAISVSEAKYKETETELAGRRKRRDALPEARDDEPLRDAVREARAAGDLEKQVADLQRALAGAEAATRRARDELPLVSGDVATVLGLEVPLPETVERFAGMFSDDARQSKSIVDAAEGVRLELEQSRIALDELELVGDVPTEVELDHDRRRRTAGWLAVRAAWIDVDPEPGKAFGEPLPDAYERSVETADRTADRLRAEADRVAKKAQLLAARDGAEREAERLVVRLADHEKAAASHAEDWKAAWAGAALDPLPPTDMREWLKKHTALRSAAHAAQDVAGRQEALQSLACDHRESLGEAVARMGESAPPAGDGFGAVLRRAEQVLEDLATGRHAREAAEEEIDRLEQREAEQAAALAAARQAMEEWEACWAAAAADLQLPKGATVSQGTATLDALDAAFERIKVANGTRRRIDGIERDAQAFDADARRLLEEVAPGEPLTDVASAIDDLQRRSMAAEKGQVRIDEATKQIEVDERRIEEARGLEADAQARLARLIQEAKVSTHEELEAVEERASRKRDCTREARELDARIAQLGADSVEALETEAAGQEHDALSAKIATLKRQAEDLTNERSQVSELIGREQVELERIDGSAAAAEADDRAQSALALARDGTERYVKLRLAAVLLRRAIETYREASQGPVLARANELLPRLTLEVINGLATDFDDKGEPVLLAVKGGRRVDVGDLSDGERDELHLALRVATLEHYFATSTPMPLILDDLFLNFDDDRARAGFKVLHELTNLTQIVFFTHHEHLVTLAQEAIPAAELTITRLPERGHGEPEEGAKSPQKPTFGPADVSLRMEPAEQPSGDGLLTAEAGSAEEPTAPTVT